mmetsp:Transcript_1420/g.2930  ORF Transcript_1420/g.2930 Transcript_1420/m.2930 type:complete len:128 (-) Transcript_1420:1171-1554(-)
MFWQVENASRSAFVAVGGAKRSHEFKIGSQRKSHACHWSMRLSKCRSLRTAHGLNAVMDENTISSKEQQLIHQQKPSSNKSVGRGSSSTAVIAASKLDRITMFSVFAVMLALLLFTPSSGSYFLLYG